MDYLVRLQEFANPPFNVLGTALFLFYIVLALYFTATTIISLYQQYQIIPSLTGGKKKGDKQVEEIKDARKRHIKIYAFLASVSFTVLSMNMLSFLIHSLAVWAREKSADKTPVSTEMLKCWMLETSLFETFAKDLVGDGASAVWSQLAILTTWFWNIWMGAKANAYGITNKTLVPFIMLSQILPISFTVILFIIQLHFFVLGISPAATRSEEEQKAAGSSNEKKENGSSETSNKTQAPRKKPYKRSALTIPTLLLNASLLALPRLTDNPTFIPLILLTRLILVLPYTGRISLRDADVMQSVSVSGGFVVANLVMMRKVVGWRDILKGLRVGGYAVKALGWDAQIGVWVYAILNWGGGV